MSMFDNKTPANNFKFEWNEYEKKILEENEKHAETYYPKIEDDKPCSSKDLYKKDPIVIEEKPWDDVIDKETTDPTKKGRISIENNPGQSVILNDGDKVTERLTYPIPSVTNDQTYHKETKFVELKTPQAKTPPKRMCTLRKRRHTIVRQNLLSQKRFA